VRVLLVEGVSEAEASVSSDRFRDLLESRDRLYRAVAMVVGDVGLAADAVDEAMARAYASWDRIGHYSSPEGWAYRVALNWARSVLRRRRQEDLWDQPPDGSVVEIPPDVELRSAVARLPAKFRTVVVARYYLDWSTSDTAEALDIPQGTVKTRSKRALARLAKDLEGTSE
jgi:RNA polymerase sigma-70 factor (ECF subfamily)